MEQKMVGRLSVEGVPTAILMSTMRDEGIVMVTLIILMTMMVLVLVMLPFRYFPSYQHPWCRCHRPYSAPLMELHSLYSWKNYYNSGAGTSYTKPSVPNAVLNPKPCTLDPIGL